MKLVKKKNTENRKEKFRRSIAYQFLEFINIRGWGVEERPTPAGSGATQCGGVYMTSRSIDLSNFKAFCQSEACEGDQLFPPLWVLLFLYLLHR